MLRCSLASPSRHLGSNHKGECEERMLGDLKPDRLGLSSKAKKCSDAGIGVLSVLTTHEILPWFSFVVSGSTSLG